MAWSTKTPPKKEGRYIISANGLVCFADRVEFPKDNWYWDTRIMGTFQDYQVQGWQKAPKAI